MTDTAKTAAELGLETVQASIEIGVNPTLGLIGVWFPMPLDFFAMTAVDIRRFAERLTAAADVLDEGAGGPVH